MATITIKKVESKKDLNRFIKFPWKIYKDDPNWVPPLLIDVKKILNKKKNPFFLHSEADLFLAEKNGEIVGRIAAILNNNHNDFQKEKTAFFGFFEAENDQEVSSELFKTVENWAQQKGMDTLRGPMNFTISDTCSLLIEGFDSSPAIMMTYNPEYYIKLLEQAGLHNAKTLLAYNFTSDMPIPERFVKFADRALKDSELNIRKIDMKKLDDEAKIVRDIFNDAWETNWGFVPLTEKEIEHLAEDLKDGIDPDIVFMAEVNGEPAGFALTLPDYNEIFKKINGRLLPFGIFKLLLGKKKIKGVRVVILGITKKYQKKRGLGPALYYEIYLRGKNKGYKHGEFSWILEDNLLMNRALEGLGAKVYKKYAIFESKL